MTMTMRTKLKLAVFTQFAEDLAGLSCCKRASVGCIIFDEGMSRIYAIGYNGQPAGLPNDSCTGEQGTCGCIHAEANAVAKLSTENTGLWLFCTTAPCLQCAGLIINTRRISRVIYRHTYRNSSGLTLLAKASISCDVLDLQS